MAGFLTAAAAAFGGSSIVGSVVRIMVAYGISRLINKNTGRDPGTRAPIDEGVRLQLAPNTTNSIPALVGSAFYGGAITDARLTNNNQTMWYAITLSEVFGFRIGDASYNIYFTNVYWNGQRVVFKSDGVTVDYVINDDGVVDASPRDLVRIYLYRNGSNTNTTLSDPETNAILPSLSSFSAQDARSLMPGWTHDHRMSNLTFALVRMDYNRDKGITGLPDIQFNVRNELYRPGDAIYAYMRSARVGAGFTPASGTGAGLIGTGRIDSTSLTALNDYADDDIAYIDSDGTTKTLADRYQINGLIDTNRPVLENLELLTQACGSYLNYDIANGLWGVIVNRNTSPVLAFDDSNIISGIQVSGTGLDALYNGVQYQFPHRQIRDKADFVTVDLPAEYRNSREPDNVLRLQTELFNEPLQARQLAYLELYQNRMDQVVTFTTDYSKINTEAGDVITITNDVYDWSAKQFRVIRVKEVESEEGGIAVEITAQEYDGTMYDAGGQPRRPGVPSTAIAIPTLGAIAKPVTPTVLTTNNQNATPSITLRSTVPGSTQANTAVIVDRMEFWYVAGSANTATSLYKLAEISQNANGNPFTTGTNQDSQPIIGLPAGTYQFRVRAGNSESFSEYSDPVQLVWDPKQRTDQVDENTQFVPKDPSLLDLLGPLAMGALAYYAYKALAPQILESLGLTDLAKLLGLDPNAPDLQQQIDAIKTQAGGFTTVDVQGGGLVDSGVSTALRFIAGNGIQITATQGIEAGEITITATGAGGDLFKTFVAGGTNIIPVGDDTITFTAGDGISITGDNTNKTVTIAYTGAVANATNKFDRVQVPGQQLVVADQISDTLNIAPGYGIQITADATTDTITISSTVSGGANTTPNATTSTYCLSGSVFPCVFGSGPTAGVGDTRVAIFTHEYLIYGYTEAATAIRAGNIVNTAADELEPRTNAAVHKATGSGEVSLSEKQNFPSLYTWSAGSITGNNTAWSSRPPALPSTVSSANNWKTGDVFHNIYYTTAPYVAGTALHSLSWGPWRKFSSANQQQTTITGYTNPPPDLDEEAEYRVDREYECGALILDADGPGWTEYDSFKPNNPITVTNTVRVLTPTGGRIKVPAGHILAFGFSCFNLPDNTAFNTNTIFAYRDSGTLTFEKPLITTQIATDGTTRVAIGPGTSRVYYSTDGTNWNPVTNVTFQGTQTALATTEFTLLAYGNGQFFVWRPGAGLGGGGGVARSSNGIAWTESVSNMDGAITSVAFGNGTWVGTGSNIIQTSTDGVTWTTV